MLPPTPLLLLILAGEAIFLLPFVLPRVFRPTFLAVFDITNLQLGTCVSLYGVIAIAAYLFGGPLADRFAPHKLMALGLAATGLGGLYLTTLPGLYGLTLVYGFWGITTILLFWAAMLRATRLVGGRNNQGVAFGLLEGGRGLVSAIVSFVGVYALQWFFPEGPAFDIGEADRITGFRNVVYVYSGLVLAAAVAIFFGMRKLPSGKDVQLPRIEWSQVIELARQPRLWLLAVIILSAYSCYRVLDDVSLLASDVLNYDDVDASLLASWSLLLRPMGAIAGGFLADRILASRASGWAFALTAVGLLAVGVGPLGSYGVAMTWLALVVGGLGIFALRGIYFALVAEARVPLVLTGTAIGLVSTLGFLPDVYMPPLTGWLVDNFPYALGHRLVFLVGVAFAAIGAAAVFAFQRLSARH